ncbi:unnamed protein product [Rotaria sp. Silwood2]|nr:unnamed protein product [Rotaria sp. Silwood2]
MGTILATTSTTTPVSTSTFTVPLRAPAIDIHPNARWIQSGLTVAGGNQQGNESNQLNWPHGLFVDDDQTIYVANWGNNRIVEWKYGAASGQVVAGGNGPGNGANQLYFPEDVIVDKERDSLIICDGKRVVQWPRRNGISGEILISNISCTGLTMDETGSLYVANGEKHEVRRYKIGDNEGTVVAGSNGAGNRLDQLNNPYYIFVDRNHSVYVSDLLNDRVMKWEEGAKQGTVVAGTQGQKNGVQEVLWPLGIVVDQLSTVYVAGRNNHQIIRWPKAATQGSIIAGEGYIGEESNQFKGPIGLSFDRYGNLYVVDNGNQRVQKFLIEQPTE